MRTTRGFILGIVFTLAALIAASWVGVYVGALPAGADVKPWRLERQAANISLRAQIARETSGLTVRDFSSESDLSRAVKLYGANCAVCHGSADAEPSKLAQGFYIKAPQLAKRGVEDDPVAESYWKIKHGIRFTAMPAFGATLPDEDLWRLASFVKTMDKLPSPVQALWEKLPSAATCCP